MHELLGGGEVVEVGSLLDGAAADSLDGRHLSCM